MHGFIIKDIVPVPEVMSVAYNLEHQKCKAKLIHLHNTDPENMLAIAFRTPPSDNTGVFHILEHNLIEGSTKYPVKNLLFELVRTGVATLLNAFTYPDKTVYPCASMNLKDFKNISSVYLDAVFSPKIRKDYFLQEGHHLEFEVPGDPNSPLSIKGVVYNEMKGVFSDLDGIISRHVSCDLFDNAYGFDSGGIPDAIPSLTFERFKGVFERYYHPSNSFIYCYGDLPTTDRLALLNDEYLSHFDSLDVDTTIKEQTRWSKSKRKLVNYPLDSEEKFKDKTAITFSFFTGTVADAEKSIAMKILDYYLTGDAASPLRKALIDSKFGSDLTDSGYASYQRDTFYTIGLKGTNPDQEEKIKELIFSTLKEISDAGLDRDKLKASFHRHDIGFRRISSDFPVSLMDRVYNSWIYGLDPLYYLKINEHFSKLKHRYQSQPDYFEDLIREQFLDNPHYITHIFTPDKEFNKKSKIAETKKLTDIKNNLSKEEMAEITSDTEKLRLLQTTPNSEAEIATLPTLKIGDIDRKSDELSTRVLHADKTPLLVTDMFTNGVNYLSLSVNISSIPDELIDYLPLYSDVVSGMGADGKDYLEMANLESMYTGGIGTSVSFSSMVSDSTKIKIHFDIYSRALESNYGETLEIVKAKLTKPDLSDKVRLKDLITQGLDAYKSNLVPSGSRYAAKYARRNLNQNTNLAERSSGITQIMLYQSLANSFEEKYQDLLEKLSRIRSFVSSGGNITASFIGTDGGVSETEQFLSDINPHSSVSPDSFLASNQPKFIEDYSGIVVPATVAFNAIGFSAVDQNHPLSASLSVLCQNLSLSFLHEKIRVSGGAYGASMSFQSHSRSVGISSYRDPNITKTFDVFGGVSEFIRNKMDLSPSSLEQSIIGTFKTVDGPLRPGQAVETALGRFLVGSTYESRQAYRDKLFSVSKKSILEANETIIAPGLRRSAICTLSNRVDIENASKKMKMPINLISV